MRSSASRKRQTRLAFTPLPSSSPAAKDYPQQIRDRAAAVTYDGSPGPTKRRRLDTTMDGSNDQAEALPTPQASLDRSHEVNELYDDSDSDPILPSQKRKLSTQTVSRKSARQQRLDFDRASNSSTVGQVTSSINEAPPLRARSNARPGMFGTQNRERLDLSSDESASDSLPSSSKLMTDSKHTKRKGKGKGKGKRKASAHNKPLTRSSQKPITIDSEDYEEEQASGQGDRQAPIHLDGVGKGDEEDEEDMPTTLGKQRRKRMERESSFIVSSPPRAIDSDDDLEILSPTKLKRSYRDAQSDDEDDSEPPTTPRRRKLTRPRQMSQQEKEDLDDDLDFLGPSSDVENSRTKRNTQTSQKTAKQKALEALKRKRAGNIVVNEDEEEDQDPWTEEEQVDYGEEEELKPDATRTQKMFNPDEDDEDFLTDEGADDTLGVPSGIPLAFTRFASMKAKEFFTYAVEWMVQKKINPAFQMNDEVYDLAFKKLDDEVRGLAGSKFISSVWTPDFTKSLQARPTIAYEPIDRGGQHFWRDRCDACNRSNHPTTWQIQFQDKPYHRETLEPVANGDEEDSDSDADSDDGADQDDQPDWDNDGREIAPANTIYYVGKFCMSNAATAHSLQHWRYHLNEWVVDWLIQRGYSTADKIVERDRWSTKKRRKYANKIADAMEKEGVIKDLYKSFKLEIETARDSKQGRWHVDPP